MATYNDIVEDLHRDPYYRERVNARLDLINRLRKIREKPITIKSLQGHSLVEATSMLARAWPAEDIRNSLSYSESCMFEEEYDPFLSDLSHGIEIKESQRSLEKGSVILEILIPNNLNEFEEYNNVVGEHNAEWLADGAYKMDFDPVTGDEVRLKDTWVQFVEPESTHYENLSPIVSSGELTDAAPKTERSVYGTIEYRVSTKDDLTITLGYVVRSDEGLILCYNEYSGQDLAKMVRRSAQEIWGNHLMDKYQGRPYLGISYLFKGHKVQVCKDRKNVIPAWCKKRRTKRPTKYGSYGWYWGLLVPVARILMPLLIVFYGLIVVPIRVLNGGDGYLGGGDSYLVTGIVASLVLIVISLNLANKFEFNHKTSELIDMIK